MSQSIIYDGRIACVLEEGSMFLFAFVPDELAGAYKGGLSDLELPGVLEEKANLLNSRTLILFGPSVVENVRNDA